MEKAVRLSLDGVEAEVARLWEEEARKSGAVRIELLTLVALVSEPALFDRAQSVIAKTVLMHPSRTIVATWTQATPASITADATLHRVSAGGPACGDAIVLEAAGGAREWLPENIDRLALPDLPVCVWWIGDLPDFDRLFDRVVVNADLIVVNSGEMDLRDLEKLSTIAMRSRDGCALSDLAWIRLRPLQELIARFFDDEIARGCLPALERVTIDFAPREGDQDVASTQVGLLFGWIANALSLRTEGAFWKRGAGWSEVTFGRVVARFEQRPRADVPPGSIVRVTIECDGARFEVERQDDPQVFRWSREAPGAPVPPQTLRIGIPDEATLLMRCLERPKRDRLLEKSLQMAVRIVRPVAPRLSGRAEGPDP
jgi:glucose-6-phosphate dehydrogenase assembly protein OpcA